MGLFNLYGVKSRNIISIYINSILAGIIFYSPILALYFQENLFSLSNVALIFSIQALGFVIFQYPTGAIADLVGRKKSMLIGDFIWIIAVIVLLFSHEFYLFAIFALLIALGSSFFSGADSALIWDTLKQERKEKYYKKIIGIKYALWPIGASIGSIVGGYLASISYSLTIGLTIIPVTLTFLALLPIKEPKYQKSKKNLGSHMVGSSKKIMQNWQLVILLLSGLVFVGIGDSVHSLKPIFYQFQSIDIIYFGYVFAASYALSSLGHYFSHDFANFVGNKKAVIIASFFLTFSIFIATFFRSWVAIFVLLAGQIFYGLGRPATEHLIHQETDSSARATVLSSYNMMRFLGVAIFSYMLGVFGEIYTINVGFRIGAAIMIVIPVLFLFLKKDK